jgi:hypothetical protein
MQPMYLLLLPNVLPVTTPPSPSSTAWIRLINVKSN